MTAVRAVVLRTAGTNCDQEAVHALRKGRVILYLDPTLADGQDPEGKYILLLAHGATRWEAARPVAREAVRTGLVPILNSMSAVGLVTIPQRSDPSVRTSCAAPPPGPKPGSRSGAPSPASCRAPHAWR